MPTVAWFRFEGVIAPRSALSCAAWMAARHHDVLGRLPRIGAAVAGRLVAGSGDPSAALALAWRGLRGASADRLHVLAEDYASDLHRIGLNAAGLRLLDAARDRDLVPVIVATHPHAVVDGIARALGVDHVIANTLELDAHDRATGRLTAPVVTGHLDHDGLAREAHARGLDATLACAYGHGPEDIPLLASAPRPCAVTPHPRLRRLAHELGWPVVEARP